MDTSRSEMNANLVKIEPIPLIDLKAKKPGLLLLVWVFHSRDFQKPANFQPAFHKYIRRGCLINIITSNIKLSYKLILSFFVGMANHAQRTQHNKFAKYFQQLKISHMCWLSCVIEIISFICQSKTITNDYFHLTNKSRDPVSGNDNFLLLVTLGIYLFDWLFKY